jgi:hypothetical protein
MQGRSGDRILTTAQLADGVGCESCHGAAEKWRTEHFHDTWKQRSSADKRSTGFVDLKVVANRAASCTACHVGDARQDVTHELIAAGHPRLVFEFGNFHQKLPKHWNTQAERREPGFDARLWAVGQATSMSAAARLLSARAANAEAKSGVWPELAEYDCFGCHHDLQRVSWRRNDPRDGVIGLPAWGTWYFAQSRLAGASHDLLGVPGDAAQQALARLAAAGPSAWRDGQPAPIVKEADDAARTLHEWAAQLDDAQKYSPAAARKLFAWSVASDEPLSSGWDAAAQCYLGLAALHDAERDPGPASPARKEQAAALSAMIKKLDFPKDFNSPANFTPEVFQTELEKIREVLAKP